MLAIYALTGAVAGLLGGLMGVGGGIIVVPVLAWAFAARGFAPHALMHLAIGTSLASIVATGGASAIAHHRHGAVHWRVLAGLTPGLIVGAALGGVLAKQIPTTTLHLIFSGFLVFVGLRLLWGKQPQAARDVDSAVLLGLAGVVIGGFSALVGIGGGTLTVPFLIWRGVSMRDAVGTSAAAAVPIALFGAASFVWSGWSTPGLPPQTSGFLYWPALAGIAPLALLMAPLGARAAHSLPTLLLRRAFGVLVLLVALKMLWR